MTLEDREHRRARIEEVDVESLLADLERCHATLAVARAAHDRLAAFVAVARGQAIARTLADAFRIVEDAPRALAMEAVLAELFATAGAPRYVLPSDYPRIRRWLNAPRTPREPDLYEVDCERGAILVGLQAHRLYIAGSRFASTALCGASFDGAILETCDFSGAMLDRSSWVGARLVRCNLTGCTLIDAALDGARFVDCTLRRADLGASTLARRPTALGAIFERCDLRESVWHERILAGAKLDRCRVAGVQGRPLLEGLEIVAPDLSPAGDGSKIGNPRDLICQWDPE